MLRRLGRTANQPASKWTNPEHSGLALGNLYDDGSSDVSEAVILAKATAGNKITIIRERCS